MMKRIAWLSAAGLLAFAAAGFAQYTMDLTGVGDGVVADGVYVSPYQGTISENNQQIYSGYMICDDFNTESTLNDPWSATATSAANLNGTEKFTATSTGYTVQQNYDAVAWLANQLLLASNVDNATAQVNYSFAIWDIFDGQTTNPDGNSLSLITEAFTEVLGGYTANNVTVFTPSPTTASQEFLVINGPAISTPEPSSAALLGVDLLAAVGVLFFLRRRFART